MAEKLHFTKTALLALQPPEKDRRYFYDTKERGLSLSLTANGIYTFFIRRRINGKDSRVHIGNFPDISVDAARRKALEIKADIAGGGDPAAERREKRAALTLGALAEMYIEEHAKPRKRTWQADKADFDRFLSGFYTRPAYAITPGEWQILHQRIGVKHGIYTANRLLERVRGLYNKGMAWGKVADNPAASIEYFKEKQRKRYARAEEIPYLYRAAMEDSSVTTRDALFIAALTGVRKGNILAMRWDEIDFKAREWRILRTKNDEPHTATLSPFAMRILRRRWRHRLSTEWVFPSPDGMGRVGDVKTGWTRIRRRATLAMWRDNPLYAGLLTQTEAALRGDVGALKRYEAVCAAAKKARIALPDGVTDIRFHDLRRTLGSWMYKTGMSRDFIGEALGHLSTEATLIYTQLDKEEVRAPVTKAHQAMAAAVRGR